jgi:hypothetical protein
VNSFCDRFVPCHIVSYQPATPANVVEVKEDLPSASRVLKLAVQTWEVRDAAGFDTAFAALSKERPDGLYVAGSPLINANQNGSRTLR